VRLTAIDAFVPVVDHSCLCDDLRAALPAIWHLALASLGELARPPKLAPDYPLLPKNLQIAR